MARSPFEDARDRIHDALERARLPAISCSFQPGGVAVLHLMGERRRGVPVLFVDTGYHFQETLEFKERITALWALDVRSVRTQQSAESQQAYVGPLYRTNPDQCCEDRKTRPLFAALESHDTWITGLRRGQAASRGDAQVVERRILPSGRVITKVNPIVDWTEAELEAYMAIYDIPVHPLLGFGYASIGCAPCTARAPLGSRSGRWAGAKTECGLHTNLNVVDVDA
jgi:phosphoadenosine phosphosulfate reductase